MGRNPKLRDDTKIMPKCPRDVLLAKVSVAHVQLLGEDSSSHDDLGLYDTRDDGFTQQTREVQEGHKSNTRITEASKSAGFIPTDEHLST